MRPWFLGATDRPRVLTAQINRTSDQARGLVAWLPCSGLGAVREIRMGAQLPLVNSGAPTTVPDGFALNCQGNDKGAIVTAPDYVKALNPVSLVLYCIPRGNPSSAANFFGVTANDSDAAPFWAYGIGDGGGIVRGNFSNGGSFVTCEAAIALTTGVLNVVVLTLTNGDQKLYINGVQRASASNSFNPTTAADSQIAIGLQRASGQGRNANMDVLDARLYNRVLTLSEAVALWAPQTRWDLYRRPVRQSWFRSVGTPVVRRWILGTH
jgi:hypothetical protein